MTDWLAGASDWTLGWGILLGAGLVGGLFFALLYRTLRAVGSRKPEILFFDGSLLRNSESSMRLFLPLLAMRLSLPVAERFLDPVLVGRAQTLIGFAMVGTLTWLGIRLTKIIEDVSSRRYDITAEDNLQARRVRTRVTLLRRILVILIGFLGTAVLLLQLPGFRAIGTGLLASAGVLGIIVGVAAQRPLGNLFAGLQIALTQPIRVEDAVIVEDEWGWIEEITLTYIVVRLWDLRRLVLPISYFLEKPFQNWTRTNASLLGSVFLYADYVVPVDELRRELERVCRETPLWDGNVCVLQVTDLTERSVQLRALVSATNAGRAWDLRCFVRERLVAFLQQKHPDALPRLRLATEGSTEEEPPVRAPRAGRGGHGTTPVAEP